MSMTVQNSQEISNVNPTQDFQKSISSHGRTFHRISDGGKVIIQSINNIAQSVLSKCIWIVSFGRYNLDSLKYLFSNQTALENKEPTASNNSPMRSAPPPPPPPLPPGNLNRTSFNRFSSAKEQELSFQSPITSETLNESLDVRSSNSIQGLLQEVGTTLTLGSGLSSPSLDRDANHGPVQEQLESNQEEVKKAKNPRVAFMDFSKESIQNALKNLKSKKKANQESSS